MAINFDEAFTKNYLDTMYPEAPPEPEQPATLLASGGPVRSDVGQVTVQGYNPGQDTAGGAFVGTRLNTPKAGQAQPTQQDREKMAIGLLDTLAGALRGAAAQTIGLPGDIRSILDLINKEGAEKYLGQAVLPTTEEMLAGTFLPPVLKEGVPNREERQKAVETAQQVGTFLPAPGVPEAAIQGTRAVVKGAKALGPKAAQMAEDFMRKQGGIADIVPPSPRANSDSAQAATAWANPKEYFAQIDDAAQKQNMELIDRNMRQYVEQGMTFGKVRKELERDIGLKLSKDQLDYVNGFVKSQTNNPFTKAPKIDTPAFKNWFGESKVIDESGAPIAVFHGTSRPDRVGEQFRKSRATSGPMAFFTNDPEIASSYAKGKTDTSLAYEDNAYDYSNWFKKKDGRSTLNLDQAGARMGADERKSIIDKLRDIRLDDDNNVIYEKGGGSIMSDSSFDFYLKNEAKGNPLTLAKQLFLESGTLYNQEEKFAKVLNLAGVKGFEYSSPQDAFPSVYKVYLSIKNPLDTDAIASDLIDKLDAAASRVRKPTQRGGADNWDKNTVDPQVWMERLKSDQKEGTTHAWTSVPDWVTKTLKESGYDGIKDTGGKGGGVKHSVWIPFEENQVKSATGNRGTFDPSSKNILKSVAIGAGGTGAAMQQEENK